ncbi:MAG: hypothetical protein R2741_05535 [Methanolobus sp.]
MTSEDKIEWDIDVSIFTNRFIMRELIKVLGIAAGITAALVLLISLPSILDGHVTSSSNMDGMKYALILVGITFILTALIVFAYYGNKYKLSYILDSKGVQTNTREDQQKKNSVINLLLIIIGLLARNPGAAGTGFLAASHQNQDLKWKKIKKIVFYPRENTITLSSGYGEKSIVFCTRGNYDNVAEFARSSCTNNCKLIEK